MLLSFKALTEKKKTNVLINPTKKDLQEKEKNHGEDCDCPKCEKERRKNDVNDGPDIATEETCGKGEYYCHDDMKCKPMPKGMTVGADGMLVKEDLLDERQKDSDGQRLSQERGRSNYGKASVRNMRATGTGGNAADPAERLVAMDARHKAHKEKRGVKTKEDTEVYWSSKALDQLDEITAKERMKRDAGAIAKKKMRNKEHNKYVNFLDVDESNIHSFNQFIQNNKPYDSQKEVSEEGDKESKVETSLLTFGECWKTHKKVGMKMKGGKLVNDCRPKTANEEIDRPYTGPDKKDRAVIKKMDNKKFASKLADYEKKMDPKKRQALKDKATKGMKFTHESKDAALDFVKAKYKGQIMRKGSNQPKKVRGAKSTVGTNKYKDAADRKKETAADAKKRGFKDSKSYIETMARYGGKSNYDKGKGLGT